MLCRQIAQHRWSWFAIKQVRQRMTEIKAIPNILVDVPVFMAAAWYDWFQSPLPVCFRDITSGHILYILAWKSSRKSLSRIIMWCNMRAVNSGLSVTLAGRCGQPRSVILWRLTYTDRVTGQSSADKGHSILSYHHIISYHISVFEASLPIDCFYKHLLKTRFLKKQTNKKATILLRGL